MEVFVDDLEDWAHLQFNGRQLSVYSLDGFISELNDTATGKSAPQIPILADPVTAAQKCLRGLLIISRHPHSNWCAEERHLSLTAAMAMIADPTKYTTKGRSFPSLSIRSWSLSFRSHGSSSSCSHAGMGIGDSCQDWRLYQGVQPFLCWAEGLTSSLAWTFTLLELLELNVLPSRIIWEHLDVLSTCLHART